MAIIADHMAEMRELCAALGLGGVGVSKLVLEISVNDVMRCYAVTYPTAEAFNPLVKFVQAVAVSEKGAVDTIPLPMSDTAKMLANAVIAGDLTAAKALADEIVEQCS